MNQLNEYDAHGDTVKLKQALQTIDLGTPGVDINNQRQLAFEVSHPEEEIEIALTFAYPNRSRYQLIRQQIIEKIHPIEHHTIRMGSRIKRHQVQSGAKGLPNIKNIIAVASGKGGVGKSTVAVNMARALDHDGARVGLLDADIYGPSIPLMLGIESRPKSPDGKTMTPLMCGTIKTMSIGFLIEGDTPMIWRGPIVTNTLKQLLSETNWGELDYLVIDLPPGTGDVQLTLAQHIPVSGAVIVTTPQNIALADVQKAIRMFEKVNIHILGLIENMSGYTCPHCGKTEQLFTSEGGGEKTAQKYNLNLLGKIPLKKQICDSMDAGESIEKTNPESFDLFLSATQKATSLLANQPIDFTANMPPIEIKNLTKNN